MDTALELRDITLRYGPAGAGRGRAVLDGASLSVAAGACVGIAGNEGSGTTTLLLCAAGLLGADSGSVRWFGSHRWHAARPAYAGPAPEAHPYLSVQAWLEFNAAQLDDASGADADVPAVLARAALTEFARIRVGHLTPGVGARVALAAALLREPRLILLDRPFDGLSGAERLRFAHALSFIRADGVTLVVSTRDAGSLSALAPDRIHALVAGRLAAATPDHNTLELDVPLPIEARSRLALRVPSVYRRGRSLRVPLRRVSPEQVLLECRALGIEVRGSRLLGRDEPSRRRVAERPGAVVTGAIPSVIRGASPGPAASG
jgi:ABC-type multidrug transport system ATPase subunit